MSRVGKVRFNQSEGIHVYLNESSMIVTSKGIMVNSTGKIKYFAQV